MPTISIIVPIYNVEKYLRKCIESILSQTFKDFELILIDDGSSDNSGKICDEYAKQDSRIIVIHQCNKGVSTARNKGLTSAKGDYIAFIDPDDYVAENYLEYLYNSLQEYSDADYAVCSYAKVDENGNFIDEISISFKTQCVAIIDDIDIYNLFSTKLIWTSLYKKSSLIINDKLLMFNEAIAHTEDVLFSHTVYVNSKKYVRLGNVLYFYLYRNDSVSHSGFNKNKISELSAYDLIIKESHNFPNIKVYYKTYYSSLSLNYMENALKQGFKYKYLHKIKKHLLNNVLYIFKSEKDLKYKLYYAALSIFPQLANKIFKISK
ncbi:MAG: glycosyltransferase [Clostridiales bacterium]|nr:glycosyltransferase [Clostridiales bacterium]